MTDTNAARQARFRARRTDALRNARGKTGNMFRALEWIVSRQLAEQRLLLRFVDYLLPDDLDALATRAAGDGLQLQAVLDEIEGMRCHLDMLQKVEDEAREQTLRNGLGKGMRDVNAFTIEQAKEGATR